MFQTLFLRGLQANIPKVSFCAFAGILISARIADKTNARGMTLAAFSFITVVGYALLIGLTSTPGRLAATCLVAFGAYPNIVLTLSWLSMSIAGYTKRYEDQNPTEYYVI